MTDAQRLAYRIDEAAALAGSLRTRHLCFGDPYGHQRGGGDGSGGD